MHFVEIGGTYTLCGNREEFINCVEMGGIYAFCGNKGNLYIMWK